MQELEISYNVEKRACDELGIQLEHRKAVAAKDEEEKQLREQRKRREEERRLQQERLQKQKEEEKKRKDEQERLKWEELRLLQEKESKEKLKQQKKEENAKKLLETQQMTQKEETITLWNELKKLDSASALPEPLQPGLSSSSISPFTSESPSLRPKKKPAPPKPPLPYKKHPPAITVTTQSPPPTTTCTDTWDANFKGITMATSNQVATATTSYYSNITMATAVATTTSPTKLKTKDVAVVEDTVTVSVDDRFFTSAPDDVLTQSTHVSADIELV